MAKYRINRDRFYTNMWAVERKTWWGKWVEDRGILRTKQDAIELKEILEEQDAR